eukprot:m51a1_g4329 hypothetical protein (2178) ;mRNA; f:113389-136382
MGRRPSSTFCLLTDKKEEKKKKKDEQKRREDDRKQETAKSVTESKAKITDAENDYLKRLLPLLFPDTLQTSKYNDIALICIDGNTRREVALSKIMGDKVIVEIVLADVGLTESQQAVLARGLQASAHRHAEDHFFTYLKWSLDIMRDTALSVSKKSIMEAGVKQAQSGEKQKKMKESTLDNKKIKVTSELNIAAIESKEVLFSKFFESQNNCKKVVLIASKLMTWKPEDVQKLFHEISKIEGIDKIPSSALEMTTLRAATEKLTRDQCRQLFQSIQDSYHIYLLVKDFISALDSDDKEQRSFSKTQLRVLKNAVRSGWLSDYVDCPASDFELAMGPVTAAIMWGKLIKESEINTASKNMEKNSILSEKPVIVNWNELVYPAKTPNRHIHYNLVVNFLLSKARDKFTSLLKSTFLALKSDPLELLHGSSKPMIDYTTVHDLLHFMSIAALELTRDKPMHRYLTEISFEHSKSSSVTKKQKPKASTAFAVISPTPQSHAELETTLALGSNSTNSSRPLMPTISFEGTWGDWGGYDLCPNGTFAVGMRTKSEGDTPTGATTAMNAIELYCQSPLNSTRDGLPEGPASLVGNAGTWDDPVMCPDDYFAVGFTLRWLPDQGIAHDNSAVNQLKFFCKDRLGNSWAGGAMGKTTHGWCGTYCRAQGECPTCSNFTTGAECRASNTTHVCSWCGTSCRPQGQCPGCDSIATRAECMEPDKEQVCSWCDSSCVEGPQCSCAAMDFFSCRATGRCRWCTVNCTDSHGQCPALQVDTVVLKFDTPLNSSSLQELRDEIAGILHVDADVLHIDLIPGTGGDSGKTVVEISLPLVKVGELEGLVKNPESGWYLGKLTKYTDPGFGLRKKVDVLNSSGANRMAALVAVGMSTKCDKDSFLGTTSGMNAIRLYCQAPGDTSPRAALPKGPVSTEGDTGDWDKQPTFCPDNYYVVGFRLMWLSDQGLMDDSAVNKLQFFCRDWSGSEWTSGELGKTAHGAWREKYTCPGATAIAGLSTQVEKAGGLGHDDTGLNGVAFECLPSLKSCSAISVREECTDPDNDCNWCGRYCRPRGQCPECRSLSTITLCLASDTTNRCAWCGSYCRPQSQCPKCESIAGMAECQASTGNVCSWCGSYCRSWNRCPWCEDLATRAECLASNTTHECSWCGSYCRPRSQCPSCENINSKDECMASEGHACSWCGSYCTQLIEAQMDTDLAGFRAWSMPAVRALAARLHVAELTKTFESVWSPVFKAQEAERQWSLLLSDMESQPERKWEESNGTVAVGMRTKSEPDLGFGTTGMNAIRLYCQAPGDTSPRAALPEGPVSTEGDKGRWDEQPTFCPDNGSWGDDSAVNQLMFFCKDWRGREWNSNALGRTKYGQWGEPHRCPGGTAIAGLSTQVQMSEGLVVDDTGLNGVAFECLRYLRSCADISDPDECAAPDSDCDWCGSRCRPRGLCPACADLSTRAECLASNTTHECSWCGSYCRPRSGCPECQGIASREECVASDTERPCSWCGPYCRPQGGCPSCGDIAGMDECLASNESQACSWCGSRCAQLSECPSCDRIATEAECQASNAAHACSWCGSYCRPRSQCPECRELATREECQASSAQRNCSWCGSHCTQQGECPMCGDLVARAECLAYNYTGACSWCGNNCTNAGVQCAIEEVATVVIRIAIELSDALLEKLREEIAALLHVDPEMVRVVPSTGTALGDSSSDGEVTIDVSVPEKKVDTIVTLVKNPGSSWYLEGLTNLISMIAAPAAILVLAVALGLAASESTSPRGPVINFTGTWGTWGPWDHCPSGTVAVGMSTKGEPDHLIGTTAMNAIRLYCQAPGDSSPRAALPEGPVSLVGDKGDWDEKPTLCPDNYYVAGFVVRWLPDQGPEKDDSAVNQLVFFCKDWRGQAWNSSALGKTTHGQWNTTYWCPNGTAVAGLSTQVQMSEGLTVDDTGLNGVAFECLRSLRSCATIGDPDECEGPGSNCSWCGSRCRPQGECLQCASIASRAACLAYNASRQCSWCGGSCAEAQQCGCAGLGYEQCTISGPRCRWCTDNCTDSSAQCPEVEMVVVTIKFAVGLNASELEQLLYEIAAKLHVDPAMVRVVQSDAGSGSGGSSEITVDISIPDSKEGTLETLVKNPDSSWYLGGLTKKTDRSWGIRKKVITKSAVESAASPASPVAVGAGALLAGVAALVVSSV